MLDLKRMASESTLARWDQSGDVWPQLVCQNVNSYQNQDLGSTDLAHSAANPSTTNCSLKLNVRASVWSNTWTCLECVGDVFRELTENWCIESSNKLSNVTGRVRKKWLRKEVPRLLQVSAAKAAEQRGLLSWTHNIGILAFNKWCNYWPSVTWCHLIWGYYVWRTSERWFLNHFWIW